MTDTIVQIIGIISVTVVAIYALYKYWQWKNPYVDTIERSGPIGGISRGKPANVGDWYLMKRTWKNGKVTFYKKKCWI